MSAVFPIEDKPRYGKYTATAGQTVFAVPFNFQQNRDVKVRKTAAGTTTPVDLVENTDYTLAGAGIPNGGQFTVTAAAAENDVFEVYGDAVLDRLTGIVQDGQFKGKVHDQEHDRHRIIQQEQSEKIGRAVRVDLGQTAPKLVGTPENGKALIYDENLNLKPAFDAGDIGAAQGYAEQAGAAAGVAAGSAAEAAASAAEAAGYVAGLAWKAPVKAGSVANLTLSGEQTVDGVALTAGDRVLVKDQTSAPENGVYIVAAGAWSRAPDMDTWDEHISASITVSEGTGNADRIFMCTVNEGGAIGTTPITFTPTFGQSNALAVTFNPAGLTFITSNNVQGALMELDAALTALQAAVNLLNSGLAVDGSGNVTIDKSLTVNGNS